ncbi:DNA polymerase I [Jiulongibacter sediminis]|uniref:DNA polymerase I n=1 Tax=Jiulongibacter sediminis TaxID=1605367 RepID=A0A0N8HAC7_9BACT|nr:DNA polymerase I [Jiulongibacter sediminis]KPM49804.1 DNA polymerase I [Jiulongibacter sediminis]TBX26841.1 DNA polymerase I [Jiulongibacter sediminis]
MPSKKLFLLDAMALIYRAHFAFIKNPRITTTGMNTSAVFGFTNTLLEVFRKENPSHIAIVFDTKAPTFRHVRFPEYKANREEMPEDIGIAIPLVKRLAKAMNVELLELDGYEADDIIGTIAKKAAREDFEVYMYTPDKDYGQLVEEHIFLYKPAFMGNAIEKQGIEEVKAKWGIDHIDQVVDMLGLMGDKVDNIPGIPGVGEKTALKYLKEYGSVEGLLEHADEIKGKIGEKVRDGRESALLSKELARIDINVPIAFDEERLKVEEYSKEELAAFLDEMEFRTLKRRMLPGESSSDEPATVSTAAPAKVKKSATVESSQMDLFGGTSADVAVAEPGLPAVIQTIETKDHRYYCIDSKEKRAELIKYLQAQDEFCFDTETTDVDAFDAELVGMSFSYLPGEAYYVPTPPKREETQAIVDEFKPVFENEKVGKIAQNLKYDISVLKTYGVRVAGPQYDTMLAHYLLEPDQRHGMDALADQYLNYQPVSIETLIGKKGKKQGNMRDVPVEQVTEYASEDADITLQLKHKLDAELQARGQRKLLDEVEVPLVHVLSDMEMEGINVDVHSLYELSETLQTDIVSTQKEIFELAGTEFNVGSPKQLGEILFDHLKIDLKPKKTPSGQYATGEDILVKYENEHAIARKILDFRELSKLKSTYVDALPALVNKRTGHIHTSYNQAVAATGRLSSNNPNLQNIPIRTERGREIRKAFIPRNEDYKIFSADYSQIELRIMAAFSEDESMVNAFNNDVDIHSTTASKVFGVNLADVTSDMRRKSKMVNFGIIYGISAFGLAQRLGIARSEAKEIIDNYFEQFPRVKSYMDECVNKARENEYAETILGRRRYLRDINSRNQTNRGFAERNAINAPIQGSAADMIKVAMINIDKWMKKENLKSKMLLQVHDELIFDAHKDELDILKENVHKLMVNAIPMKVKIDTGMGIGENWLEAH